MSSFCHLVFVHSRNPLRLAAFCRSRSQLVERLLMYLIHFTFVILVGPPSLLRLQELLFLLRSLASLFSLDFLLSLYSLYLWSSLPLPVLNICYFCFSRSLICFFARFVIFVTFVIVVGRPSLVRFKHFLVFVSLGS